MNLHRSATFHWRWPAALGLLVTAAVHVDIAPEHLREAPYAGVLFLVLSAAAAACAVLLVATARRAAWVAAGTLCLAALGAYCLSRSVGLPMLADDIGDWLNPLGVAAVLAEGAVVLISARVLSASSDYRSETATDLLYTVWPAGPTAPEG